MRFQGTIEGQTGPALIAQTLARNGPLVSAGRVPEDAIAPFDGRLPAILLDMWATHGTGVFEGQTLSLCLPGALQGVLALLFRGDPDFGTPPARPGQHPSELPVTDCHAIAYGPFGKLFVWSARHRLMLVDMQLGLVDAPFLSGAASPAMSDDALIAKALFGMPPEALDLPDDAGQPMYAAARAAHDPLLPGQIYGTQPVVSFGDPVAVDRLARVPAADWMTERVSGTVFKLADIAAGRFDLRRIGPPPGPAGDPR